MKDTSPLYFPLVLFSLITLAGIAVMYVGLAGQQAPKALLFSFFLPARQTSEASPLIQQHIPFPTPQQEKLFTTEQNATQTTKTKQQNAMQEETILTVPAAQLESTTSDQSRNTVEKVNGKAHHVRGKASSPKAITPVHLGKPNAVNMYQDTVVPPKTVGHLATMLVNAYTPATRAAPATLQVSLQQLNTTFNSKLTSFGPLDVEPPSRQRFFAYALSPPMIESLYTLYTPYFISVLANELHRVNSVNGTKRKLTQAEKAEFYTITAALFTDIRSIILAYLKTPSIHGALSEYLTAESILHDYQKMLKEKYPGQPLHLVLDSSAKNRYQSALVKKIETYVEIIEILRSKSSVSVLHDADLFYAATWLYRRGFEITPTFQVVANKLSQCALTLTQRAEGLRKKTVSAK